MDEEASIAAALEAELASVNTPVLSFSRPDSAVLFSGSSLPRLLWSARRKHRSSEEVSPEAHNRLTRRPSSEEVVSHPHSRARHYQGSAIAFVPGSSVCRGAERPSETSFGLEKDARAPPHRRTSKLLSRERSPQNDVGYMHAIYAPTAEIESILGDTSAGPRVASGEIWDPSSTFCSPIASDRDGKLEGKTEDEQDDGGLAELLSVQSEIQRQLVRVQEAMLSDCRVFSSLAARVAGGARSLQNPDLYRKQLARHTRNKSTTPLFVPFRPLNQQQRTETRHATHSNVFEGRSGDPRLPYVSAAAPAPRFLCTSPSSGVSRIKRVSSARAAQAEQYNRLHFRVTNSARPDAATGRFSASTPVAASPQMNQVGRKRVRTADDVKTHFFFHPKSGGGDVTTTRAQNISRAKRRNRRHSFSADDLHSLQSGANGRRYDADSSYACPPSFPHPRVFSQSKSPQSPRPSKHARRLRALAGERERSANSQNAPECALATLNGFLEACREAQETDYGMGVSDRHAFRLRNCDEELPAIGAEANRGRVGGTCVSEEYDRRQGTNNSAETEDFGEVDAPHLVRSQLASVADSSALGASAGHGHPGDAMSSQKFPSVSPSCMSREHYSTACPSRFSSSVADSAECPQNARHRDQKKSTFDIERDKLNESMRTWEEQRQLSHEDLLVLRFNSQVRQRRGKERETMRGEEERSVAHENLERILTFELPHILEADRAAKAEREAERQLLKAAASARHAMALRIQTAWLAFQRRRKRSKRLKEALEHLRRVERSRMSFLFLHTVAKLRQRKRVGVRCLARAIEELQARFNILHQVTALATWELYVKEATASAALRIQAAWRGRTGRQQYKRAKALLEFDRHFRTHVIKIQSVMRGAWTRKRLAFQGIELPAAGRKRNAATTIQRVFRGCRIRRRLRHTMEGVRSLTGGTVEAMQEVDISELSFLDSFQSDDCSDLFTLSLPMSSFYFLHDVAFPVHPIVSPCSTEHPFPQRISQVSRRKKLPLSREGLPEGCPSVEGKAFSSVPSVPPPSCLSPATEPRLPTPSPSIPPPIKKGLEPNGPASVKAPPSPPEGHAEGEGDRAEEGRRRAETTGEKEERRSRNDVSEKRDSGTTSEQSLAVDVDTEEHSHAGIPDQRLPLSNVLFSLPSLHRKHTCWISRLSPPEARVTPDANFAVHNPKQTTTQTRKIGREETETVPAAEESRFLEANSQTAPSHREQYGEMTVSSQLHTQSTFAPRSQNCRLEKGFHSSDLNKHVAREHEDSKTTSAAWKMHRNCLSSFPSPSLSAVLSSTSPTNPDTRGRLLPARGTTQVHAGAGLLSLLSQPSKGEMIELASNPQHNHGETGSRVCRCRPYELQEEQVKGNCELERREARDGAIEQPIEDETTKSWDLCSSLQLLVAPPTRKAYSSVGSPGDGAAVTLKKMEIKPHAPSVSSKLQALRGENSLGSSPSRIDARLRFRSEPIVEDQGGSQKVSESNVLDGTSTFTDHRCLSPLTREKRDNFARFGHEHQRDKKPFQAREAGVAGMESLLDRLRTVQEIRPHAAEAAASLAISGEVEIGKVLHRASFAATPVHNESRSQQSKSTTSRSQHTSAHNSYVSREESTDCCSLTSSCTKRQHTALIPSERRCEKNHRTANVTASVDMEKLSPHRNQNSVHKRADYWAHFPQPASTTVLSAENADARADLVVPQFEDHVPQTHMASRESQAGTSDKHINRNAFWDGENTPATCAVLPIVISRQQLLLRRGTTRAERMEISHQKRKRNSLSTITRPVSESFACFAADGDKRVSFRRSGREGDINALELMSTHKTSSHNIAQSPLNCDRQDDRNIRDIREQLAAVRDQLQRLPKTRKAQNAVARWKLVQELQTLEEQEKLLMERSLSGGVR